jgi:hypothetical protein
MAKSHKAQHWIPKSYLRPWTDPQTPKGQEPFLHVFSKDGLVHRRKAPTNLFTETDLYTIKLPDGRRDLRLERGLSSLESAFSAMRADFLAERRQLPEARFVKFMAFVAAMHSRTPAIRDHLLRFWSDAQEQMERVERRMRMATAEERKRAASVSLPHSGPSMTLDDVRAITARPMEHTLGASIAAEFPLLMRMRCVVLCSTEGAAFITSDNPVIWFDPYWHRKPPIFRSASFSDPHLEITMPLSPEQTLLLMHGIPGLEYGIEYVNVGANEVREMNRRIRFHCDKEFVGRTEFVDPAWFDRGTMPADAWELTTGEVDAGGEPIAQKDQ